MKHQLTARRVHRATQRAPWALGDDWLYAMCRAHPHHTDPQAVWAKVSHIGRVYSAAIERRRRYLQVPNDRFYKEQVVPRVIGSPIDKWIAEAQLQTPGTPEALHVLVEVHACVTHLFHQISGLSKRSLAAKYLHFHVPALFFIFDSRTARAIRTLRDVVDPVSRVGNSDAQYATFAQHCARLTEVCAERFAVHLDPRAVDNLLLALVPNQD